LLQVKVSSKANGSIKLCVTAPYWVVNKAGIPLIFRQDNVQEAAGQFEEHEMARSLSPMLFSLADREAGSTMAARIGTGLHPGCQAQWCQPFALQKGVKVRSFHVTPRDGRPELVYLVGISIRAGRGRYRDTHIVSLAPCYQLYNQSGWRLEVSQAYFATTFTDPGAQSTYLNLLPGCHLPFHWPRLDKEQLLCIRLPDDDQQQHGRWSGGFAIRNVSSFHVSVRDADGGHPRFLRVEILQQEECTFRVVFSDAGGFPPPIRVDNLSQVPIIFHQSDVPEACLHTTVRPGSSVPYVWDEPTRGGRLTVIAPGGASSAYDMTTLKEGNQLTYENFIYVCLSVTFDDQLYSKDEQEQLVLDVPEGTRVVLNRKEAGQRSQLWRMTGSGMLQHEGSSPPRDPSVHHPVDPSRILVLDIAGPALQPSQYVHLMLRKPDPRRLLTQTWRFTDDGRLCCGHSNVFVQAKDGFYGVRKGNLII
jgi:vacuolar protein sorting-associated protein 13D